MRALALLLLSFAATTLCLPSEAAPRRGTRKLLRPTQSYAVSNFPALRWRTTLGMPDNTAPAIADLDLDGALDIVFPALGDSHELVRLTDGGAVKWRFALPRDVTAGVTLGDVNRDGTLDLVLACGEEMLCVDARGRKIWSARVGGTIQSFPTIADLDLDGAPEVLFGSDDNSLHVLTSKGTPKWKFKTESWIVNGVAVANVTGDPKLEVVFGSMDRKIHCLDAGGRELWNYGTGDWVQSSPAIGDVDKDGGLDIVATSDDGYLYCLSRRGTLKWQARIAEPETRQQPFVVLADLDGEGTLETIVAQQNGDIRVYLSNGDIAWTHNRGEEVTGSPLVADLNGDGYQDVVFATQSGYLHALSTWGGQQWSVPLGQGTGATPTLADFDHDGKWEIYIANSMPSGKSGFFSVYELSKPGGAAAWPALKGDPYRTGYAANARDFGTQTKKGGDYATAWEPFGAGYRPKTGVQPPRKLRVTMLPLDDARGNRDGALDPGETAWVRINVKNSGRGPSYENTLRLDPGQAPISLDRNSAYLGWIAPGATKTAVFRISAPTLEQLQAQLLREATPKGTFRDVAEVPQDDPDPVTGKTRRTKRVKPIKDLQATRPANLTLRVYEDGVPAAVATARLFKVPNLPPQLRIVSTQILDGRTGLTSGNGNGRLEAGESAVLRLRVRNDNLTTAENATATLASATKEVLPATPSVRLGTMVPYAVKNVDFALRVSPQIWSRQVSLKFSTYTTTKSGPSPAASQNVKLPLGATKLDITPPTIQLTSPQDAIATVRTAQITISGVVRDDSPLAALLFERRTVKWLPGNRFAFTRKLAVGENVFPIAATDAAGNTTTRWVRIVRKP